MRRRRFAVVVVRPNEPQHNQRVYGLRETSPERAALRPRYSPIIFVFRLRGSFVCSSAFGKSEIDMTTYHARNHFLRLILLTTTFINNGGAFFPLPLFGAPLYQQYLEQGIRFRENVFLGNEPILREYDFIVVGAGPGGSVVANRLSENPDWKVLLLESGEDENIYTDIPASAAHWSQTSYNWGHRAERTGSACLAMKDERCPMPRGRGMGGSSILNYMIYTRGHRKDYDDWAAAGNTGWSYKDVLPYFLKSENSSIPEYYGSPYHAHDGYLNVERIRYRSILLDAFLKAGQESGYDLIDYTKPTQHGFSWLQTTQRRGRRCSSSKAYLKSVKHRTNLHVSILTRVTKVLIDPKTKKAYGVEFSKNYRRRVVYARKEVILSAGALNSPQLLMLSGIGPRQHLTEMGVPVLQDSHVGDNMYEHYSYIGLMFLVNRTNSAMKVSRFTPDVFLDWLNNGRGLLTLPGGTEGLAYIHSKYNRPTPEDDRADVEFIFLGASLASDNGGDIRTSFGITDYMYQQMFSYGNNKDAWTIVPMLLHPRSKGRVRLQNNDPWSLPKVFFNYFEDEHDVKVLVDAIQKILRLSETRAFQEVGSILNPSTLPQCSQHAFKSDAYWACMVRYFTGTLHHQSGTCKMGPRSDPTAVVDPQLRVYGIKNLRVVDASIFPKIPGAHLYAPVLMAGEKASDMIKRAWYNRPAVDEEATTTSAYDKYESTTFYEKYERTTTSFYEKYERTTIAPCLNGTVEC